MSFDYNVIKYMNLFTPEALANQFVEQYQFEYGQRKVIEIVRKIEDSNKVNEYINGILEDNIRPSAKGLETLMNTINYFMFSKEETLCLGGLATFILWRNRYMIKENIYDILEQENIDDHLTPICVSLIDNCSKNKYNKFDNFFLRFGRRIVKIVNQEKNVNGI
jgi:hypothetical protein